MTCAGIVQPNQRKINRTSNFKRTVGADVGHHGAASIIQSVAKSFATIAQPEPFPRIHKAEYGGAADREMQPGSEDDQQIGELKLPGKLIRYKDRVSCGLDNSRIMFLNR